MKKAAMLPVALAVTGCLALFGCSGGSEGEDASEQPTEASEPTQATQAEEEESATSEANFAVTIDDCTVTTDYEGNSAIVVTYTWTNNSEDAQSFEVAIDDKAFQNGVQLDYAVVESMDSEASWNEVKPGSTNTVQQAFLLDDQSDVTIECTELISFDDTILAEATFSVA